MYSLHLEPGFYVENQRIFKQNIRSQRIATVLAEAARHSVISHITRICEKEDQTSIWKGPARLQHLVCTSSATTQSSCSPCLGNGVVLLVNAFSVHNRTRTTDDRPRALILTILWLREWLLGCQSKNGRYSILCHGMHQPETQDMHNMQSSW